MDKIQFATLIGYICSHINRELSLEEIRDLEQLTKVDLVPLFTAIIKREKIDAVKEHLALTGLGLKESKDEVDQLMFELAPLTTKAD